MSGLSMKICVKTRGWLSSDLMAGATTLGDRLPWITVPETVTSREGGVVPSRS